jgi:pimeloyl-ACP methyl ester carboxylesterase
MREARVTAALVLPVVAAVAVLAAGCGSRTAALQHRLLTVADLPSGWSATPTSGKNALTVRASCLSSLSDHPRGRDYGVAAFVEGTSVPNLVEVLATGRGVPALWQRLAGALGRCHTSALRLGTTKVEAAVHPLSLPSRAGASSAYAWTFGVQGIRLGFDLVLFRSGAYSGYVAYADLGSPRRSTVTAFVRAAIAKAASGSTAPVPDSVSIASTPVQTVRTGLGTVGYRAMGHGPPLLLITGYSGTMEGWDPRFVDALAERRRVILFDNAGVGETAALPSRLTVDGMADQASALVAALGLKHVDVLGWSMGSMVAQALAVLHPSQVRRLILCAAFPGDGSAVRPSRRELNAFESGRPQDVLAALFPAGEAVARDAYLVAVSSYPAAPAVPSDVLRAQRRAVDAWWSGADRAGPRGDEISAPTLVADGTVDRLDPTANSRALAKLIPGATLELYPDAGHAFLFQDRATFVSRVEAFLG